MKYAAAMRFGGQLVEAIACDYSDYKYLGLLCPECKDPVFLRAEGVRALGEKEIKISPHFSHFPAKDPTLAKLCEKRVAQYTEVELQKRVSQARGQRLKFFQRWFWECLEKTLSSITNDKKYDLNKIIIKGQVPIDEAELGLETAKRYFDKTRDQIKDEILFVLHSDFEEADTTGCMENHFTKLARLDKNIHSQIVVEVICFLTAKRQHQLAMDIISFLLMWASKSSTAALRLEHCDSEEDLGKEMTRLLIELLILVPWSDEFAKVKREEACTLRQNPNPSHTLGTLEHAVDNFYEHGRP